MAREPIDLKSPIFIPTNLLKSELTQPQTSPTGSELPMTFFPAEFVPYPNRFAPICQSIGLLRFWEPMALAAVTHDLH